MVEAWGKLDRRSADPANAPRLSLVAHCIDVAAVVQALLALPTWRRRFERLASRPLTEVDIARLGVIAFLHDVGKAGAGFQSKGLHALSAQQWRQHHRADKRQVGHVLAALPLLDGGDASFDPLCEALGSEVICGWGGPGTGAAAVVDLWLAAVSHHGEPMTRQAALENGAGPWPTWFSPIDGYEPESGLRQLHLTARALWPLAFEAQGAPLIFPAPFIHAYAGLVSLADWIGSNADEGFFPYDLGQLGAAMTKSEHRWPIARARASDVLRAMRLDVEAARTDLVRRQPTFESLWGAPPRPLQTACAAEDLGPLVVLEAETGSGKTEAALWRFKSLFERGEVDALCFLLPTRVAATSIYTRLWGFIEALFPDPALRPSVVLAVPGYLRANGVEGKRDTALNNFDVLWPDDGPAGHKHRFWAAEHSKRYFAGALVAGTIDQFLLSTLTVKHAHLRASLLLRSLVVVDEVHASDAYMTALTEIGLARHIKAGGQALLMSATLTGAARAALLLCADKPQHRAVMAVPLSAADAPYPAISDRSSVRPCARGTFDKVVEVQPRPWMADADAVAQEAAKALDAGARVLILRNTVRQAQATQSAVEALIGADHPALLRTQPNAPAALHHGRYAFEDRRLLDAAVEARFGKAAAQTHCAALVMGTQTLEISIDCDADLLITDLAPVDVLLQRIGRLHRHALRNPHRPENYQEPRVIVLTPADRNLSNLINRRASGLGIGPRSAYDNLLAIEAAWRLMEAPCADENNRQLWRVPEDNRRLVEAGADPARLDALAQSLGGEWPQHYDQQYAKTGAQRGMARPLTVNWDKAWSDAAWSDLGEQLRTRLGLDSIDLTLPEPWTSPLGGRLRALSMPAWMMPAGAGDPLLTKCAADDRALTFEVSGRAFIYDRLGLRQESH